MKRKDALTKVLAIAGTVLVWLPILAPVLLALPRLFTGRRVLIDYLMPAELFPVALVGSGLLIWAALRARSRLAIVGGSLGVAVVMLVGSQALAVVTGLASGKIEPGGWPWALVLALLAIFVLAVAGIGIGGALLIRDLFRPAQPSSEAAP